MPQLLIEDLKRIKEKVLSTMVPKDGEFRCMVCAGTGCVSCKSLKVRERLETELKNQGLSEKVKVVITGCNGFCAEGPIMVVYPEGIFYKKLNPEEIPFLVEEHFLKGRPVEKFLYTEPAIKEKKIPLMKNIPFFHHQVLRALRNRSTIDAENIDEYIARDGYAALSKALSSMKPEQVIQEVKTSGLRGRGGGGISNGFEMGGGTSL